MPFNLDDEWDNIWNDTGSQQPAPSITPQQQYRPAPQMAANNSSGFDLDRDFGDIWNEVEQESPMPQPRPQANYGGGDRVAGGLNDYLMKQGGGQQPRKQFDLGAEWNQAIDDPIGSIGDAGWGIAKGLNNVGSAIDVVNPFTYAERALTGDSGRDRMNRQAGMYEKYASHALPFNAAKIASEALSTSFVPGGMAGSLARRMATGALSGGLTAGMMNLGEQQASGQPLDFGQAALHGAVGAPFGAVGGAIARGIEKVIAKYAAAKAAAVAAGEANPAATIEDLLASGHIDPSALSAEENAALQTILRERQQAAAPGEMPQAQPMSAPAAGAQSNDLLQALVPQLDNSLNTPGVNVSNGLNLSGRVEQSAYNEPLEMLDDALFGLGGRRQAPAPVSNQAEDLLSQLAPPMQPSAQPDVQLPGPSLVGDFRFPMAKDAAGKPIHGQDRGALGDDLFNIPLDQLTPERYAALLNYGKAKLTSEEAKRAKELFAKALYEAHGNGTDPLIVGRHTVEGPHSKPTDTFQYGQSVDKIRDEFTDALGKKVEGGAYATLEKETLKGLNPAIPPVHPNLSQNEQIIEKLLEHADLTEQAQKSYREIASPIFKELHNEMQKAGIDKRLTVGLDIGGKRVNVEYRHDSQQRAFLYDLFKEKLEPMQEMLTAQNREARKAAGLPLTGADKFEVNPHSEMAEQVMQKYFDDLAAERPDLGFSAGQYREFYESVAANKAAYEEALATNRAAHEAAGTKTFDKPVEGGITSKRAAGKKTSKAAAAIAGGIGTYALAGQLDNPAEAATKGGTKDRHNAPLARTALVAGLGLGGAAILTALNPKAANNWIKSGAAFAGKFYGDSKFNISTIDEVLGTQFVKTWQKHDAQSVLFNLGVKFDSQTLKATAMGHLRQGLDPNLALAGEKGTAFEYMTPQQRQVTVANFLQRKSLGKETAKQMQMATAYNALHKNKVQLDGESPNGQMYLPGMSQHALPEHIANSDTFKGLSDAERKTVIDAYRKPGSKPLGISEMWHLSAMDKALNDVASPDPLANLTGGAMDFLFQFNPSFHSLNILDLLTTGASRVGPVATAKATWLMAKDKEIRSLFANSNIVGSFKGDRLEAEALAAGNIKGPSWKDWDLPSDEFNANHLTLASHISSYQASLAKSGNVTEKEFLTAVMKNKPTAKVSQEQIDDAWFSAVDNNMRALGVDPFKVNKNFFQLSPYMRYVAAFINQPARIGQLFNEYLRTGQYDKAAKFVALTGAISGKASIPVFARVLGEYVAPEETFATESALDDIALSKVAGRDISRKTEYDPLFYPWMAATHPGFQNLKEAPKDAIEMMKDARKGNYLKAGKTAFDTAAMTGLANKVPLAGMISRGIGAINDLQKGKKDIYSSENVTMQRFGKKTIKTDPATSLLNMLMPGEDSVSGGYKDLLREQSIRKTTGNKKPAKQMMYQDPLLGLAPRR